MCEKKYVLVLKTIRFYSAQGESKRNIRVGDKTIYYLGDNKLVKHICDAIKFTLAEAEAQLKGLSWKSDWKIWSIRKGWELDEESKRHVQLKRYEELQKEMVELKKKLDGYDRE